VGENWWQLAVDHGPIEDRLDFAARHGIYDARHSGEGRGTQDEPADAVLQAAGK